MGKAVFYHLKINLSAYARASDTVLADLMKRDDGGQELPPERARALIQLWLEQGLGWGPPCDHQATNGECLGHPDQDG